MSTDEPLNDTFRQLGDSMAANTRRALKIIQSAHRERLAVERAAVEARLEACAMQALSASLPPEVDSDTMTEPYLTCPSCGALIRARQPQHALSNFRALLNERLRGHAAEIVALGDSISRTVDALNWPPVDSPEWTT